MGMGELTGQSGFPDFQTCSQSSVDGRISKSTEFHFSSELFFAPVGSILVQYQDLRGIQSLFEVRSRGFLGIGNDPRAVGE